MKEQEPIPDSPIEQLKIAIKEKIKSLEDFMWGLYGMPPPEKEIEELIEEPDRCLRRDCQSTNLVENHLPGHKETASDKWVSKKCLDCGGWGKYKRR